MCPRLAFNSIQRWRWPWTSGHFLRAENIGVCLHTWIMLGVESEGFVHTRRALLCLSVCLPDYLSTYLPINSAAYLTDATNYLLRRCTPHSDPLKPERLTCFYGLPSPPALLESCLFHIWRLLNLSNAWRGCSRREVEELAIEISVCFLLATV